MSHEGDPHFTEATEARTWEATHKAAAAKLEQSRKDHKKILAKSLQFPAKIGISPTKGEGDLLNWMKFQATKISGGFKDTKVVQFDQNNMGSIALPIPAGIQATYDQSWNQTTVSAVQQAAARAVDATVGGRRIVDFLTGVSRGGRANIGAESAKGQFASASLGQELLAAGLRKTGLAETMQMTMGVRVLDQIMMSYGGPAFRNFSYTFALKPLSMDDTIVIEEIVRFFKLASAPLKMSTQFSRLYDLPAVFKISFHNGNEENTWLPKIGHCALTNVGVSYGGDTFTTYDGTGGAPVQVDLSLQFKEMELLDRDNFGTPGENDF